MDTTVKQRLEQMEKAIVQAFEKYGISRLDNSVYTQAEALEALIDGVGCSAVKVENGGIYIGFFKADTEEIEWRKPDVFELVALHKNLSDFEQVMEKLLGIHPSTPALEPTPIDNN